MYRLLSLAAAVAVLAPAAAAVTVDSFTGDLRFQQECNNKTPGGTSQDCEAAVGEIRSGDGAGNAQDELLINVPLQPNGVGFRAKDGQNVPWVAERAYDLSFAHDGGDGLTLSLTDTITASTVSSAFDLDDEAAANGGSDPAGLIRVTDAKSLYIRTAARDGLETSVALNGLSLTNLDTGLTSAIGSVFSNSRSTATGTDEQYLVVSDFDWAAQWVLTGQLIFDFEPGQLPSGSNLNVGLKLTDVVQPVPLPTGAVLLLSALVGIGILQARRR
ncbi:MAG: VPLPA-CTERM sorting domain-containing protein [Pseudomonadota bacterium]